MTADVTNYESVFNVTIIIFVKKIFYNNKNKNVLNFQVQRILT